MSRDTLDFPNGVRCWESERIAQPLHRTRKTKPKMAYTYHARCENCGWTYEDSNPGFVKRYGRAHVCEESK